MSILSWIQRWRPKLSVVRDADGSVYLVRVRMNLLRLHVFYRGDHDPDHHDHPWGFWTFPLRSYVEELPVPDGVVLQVVRSFRWHYRPATYTHRVIGPYSHTSPDGTIHTKPGKIVTVVWREEISRVWGFLKRRDGKECWVYWRDYEAGAKHTPCNDEQTGV